MNVRHDMIVCFVVRPGPSGALSDGEFLQLRRAPGEYLAGTWHVVRGTVEAGETAWQAAIRELKEETGLVPRAFYKMTLLDSFYLAQAETIWHCPAFCAVVDRSDGVVLNQEHDAHRWVGRTAIDAASMWATERNLVVEVAREILDDGPARPHLRVHT